MVMTAKKFSEKDWTFISMELKIYCGDKNIMIANKDFVKATFSLETCTAYSYKTIKGKS